MNKNSKAYSYAMLFILMLGTAILYYSNMIYAVRANPAQAGELIAFFGVSPESLGALIPMISTIAGIPSAIFSIIVGNILDRRGVKMFVGAAMILTVACMAARIFIQSYAGQVALTTLIGTFLLPIIIIGPKMIGSLFEPKDIPFAMGCYGAAGGMGTTLAFFTGPMYSTLPAGLTGITVIGAVVMLAWFIVCKNDGGGSEGPAPEIPKGAFSKVLKSSVMWKTMICGGCAVGASLIMNSNLQMAFGEKGFDASVLGTCMNVALIAGGILSGMVLGKIGKFNVPYLFICIVGGALFVLGWLVEPGPLTYVIFILAGLIVSASVGVNFTRIPLLHMTGQFGIEMTGAASGMLQTALGVFQFVLPTIVGAAFADYTMKFIMALVFLTIAGVLGLTIPELGIKGKLAQQNMPPQP